MKAIFFEDFDNSYIPHILQEMYIEKVYDQFFKGKKDLTVMDCGGNIGLFTFFVEPHAKKIYTVEPSAKHTKVIKHMIEYNDFADKVEIVEKAISHEDGTATFHHNSNQTMFSVKSIVDDGTEDTEEVETIRMDTLFTQLGIEHIDFLKLDIEGSECEVIGGEGFENIADKIDAMVIEWHDWSGRNPMHIKTSLEDYGFEVFSIPAKAKLFGAIRSNK